jgi:hypothetical protein
MTPWPGARIIERPSATWELIGDAQPCARDDGGAWYWCALRKIGAWPVHSGVVRVPPLTGGADELAPQLADVVSRARALRGGALPRVATERG